MAQFKSNAVVHRNYKTPVYVTEVEIPPLKPTQILVKTEYASINPVDIKLHALSFTSSEKNTLKDFSGTIAALGSQVKGKFEEGQKVWGSVHRPGKSSFVGSYTLVNESTDVIAPVPSSLTMEQAGSIGVVYGTAYQLLEKGSSQQTLGPESSILVLGGATSVGSYVVQLAKKQFNVGKVVVTCSPASADYAKSFGADDVICYKVPSLREEMVKYVERTGKKFNAILDTVGGYDAIAVSDKIMKPASQGSSYVTIMGDAGPARTYAATMLNAIVRFPAALFRLIFGKYYGIDYHLLLLTKGKWVTEAPEVFGTPGFKVPIDSVYPLGDLKAAWAKVDSTRARGKVVVKF